MDTSAIVESLRSALQAALDLVTTELLTTATAVQLGALLVAGGLALLVARPLRRLIDRGFEAVGKHRFQARVRRLMLSLAFPVLWLLALCVLTAGAGTYKMPYELLRIGASLLGAWIAIRVVTSFVADPFWSRTTAVIAWTIAALNILHLLVPVSGFLDSIAVTFGATRLSAYMVIKGVALAGVLLWLATSASSMLSRRIEHVPSLTPSIRVLLSQVSKLFLVGLAVVVSLGSIGIDLTALTVFGGAVGVGVGFGLQKVVSNLVSGIILLLDASIKPGDVIEIGGTYGWVNSLGARYASVVTRDGTEYLIPNEDLITQQVVNWSYSNRFVRRHLSIGVHYEADIDLATRLVLEAAGETERILEDPEPRCLLTGFGDNAIDMELRFWIEDPQNGVSNIADEVLRRVWRKFRDNGVEIPYPQRDLHIRSGAPLAVKPAAAEAET